MMDNREEFAAWVARLSYEDRERAADVLIEVWRAFDVLPPSKARSYAVHLLGMALHMMDPDPFGADDVDVDLSVWGEVIDSLPDLPDLPGDFA